MDSGGQCVMICGEKRMPQWCANSLGYCPKVRVEHRVAMPALV